MRTALSFVAGAALAVLVGTTSGGCGCKDDSVAPISAGTYALVEPDPTPYVGYVLTYSETGGTGTVREA